MSDTATAPPASHRDLLERPLCTHLATVRPDGGPQSNVMWFIWDGERIRFTHTDQRQKFRNLQANPHVAMSVPEPGNPYRYLEVRGVVEDISRDDADASFYRSLQERYGRPLPISDAAHRVVITVRPTHFVAYG